MSILEKLTEGIVRRDLSKEGAALLSKWENTSRPVGLLQFHIVNIMTGLVLTGLIKY